MDRAHAVNLVNSNFWLNLTAKKKSSMKSWITKYLTVTQWPTYKTKEDAQSHDKSWVTTCSLAQHYTKTKISTRPFGSIQKPKTKTGCKLEVERMLTPENLLSRVMTEISFTIRKTKLCGVILWSTGRPLHVMLQVRKKRRLKQKVNEGCRRWE